MADGIPSAHPFPFDLVEDDHLMPPDLMDRVRLSRVCFVILIDRGYVVELKVRAVILQPVPELLKFGHAWLFPVMSAIHSAASSQIRLPFLPASSAISASGWTASRSGAPRKPPLLVFAPGGAAAFLLRPSALISQLTM